MELTVTHRQIYKLHLANIGVVKQGQMLEAKARILSLKPTLNRQGRGEGQMLKYEIKLYSVMINKAFSQ